MSDTTLKHHLLISGTGRAGTSFLVRFLTELGLDTTLARRGSAAHWDEHAEAGLEEAPLMSGNIDLPYVIKSPAAAEILSTALASGSIAVDAIIVPMRRLDEAAASRCVLELRALHEHQSWRTELDDIMPTHGHVAGGILYSLHPLDQARVLAMAFHNLILIAAEAEIPVFPVTFPRLIEDWLYLWRAISPALPTSVTEDAAEAAHKKVVSANKVRMEPELAEQRSGATGESSFPNLTQVDNIAMRREIRRLRELLAQAKTSS